MTEGPRHLTDLIPQPLTLEERLHSWADLAFAVVDLQGGKGVDRRPASPAVTR